MFLLRVASFITILSPIHPPDNATPPLKSRNDFLRNPALLRTAALDVAFVSLSLTAARPSFRFH